MSSESANRGGTEVSARAPAAPSDTAVPRLSTVQGPGAGRAFAMSSAMATVGRHPTNDLVVSDPRVSGVHLQLRRVGARVVVRDAGSTNGTWVGPHRVTELEVGEGAELLIGDTVLRFDVDTGPTSAVVGKEDAFGELVGVSTAMRELFATLGRLAGKGIGVLVQGETGTGKEEVARALHARSPRAEKPFVVIDATSLPETLAESLLFGHVKGAFTGADRRGVGYFEAAQGGTVFLDEVGELPGAIQGKFLRVLERREIVPVGSHTPLPVDVRVIAATHRDLRHEIEAGRFREDLYFRIAQAHVLLAPLRDRPEDIPVIAQKLLARIGNEGDEPLFIEASALAYLQAQTWPGNVREVRNVLARAAALATNGLIRREDVAGEGLGFRGTREERDVLVLSGKFGPAKELAVTRFESAYLAALMRRTGGNVSAAAREADLARHYLRELLRKHGLYGVSWGDADE